MHFQYLEIRPCVETNGQTVSFLGKPEFHEGIGDDVYTPANAMAEAMAYLDQHGGKFFWTIYGRDEEGLAVAIGDFTHMSHAFEVMNAILAPMAEARDKIRDCEEYDRAADDLDDFINQCSNEERL